MYNYEIQNIASNLEEVLPKEEQKQLFIDLQNGDKVARRKLIEHNLRLVSNYVLKKYGGRFVELDELFSVGAIGLIKAVDTFDINREVEFSTYATTCIRFELNHYFRSLYKNENSLSLDSCNPHLDSESEEYNNFSYEEQGYEDVLKQDEIHFVRNIINSLTNREKQIIELRFGFNDNIPKTCDQISDSLNISRQYIHKSLNKSYDKLRPKIIRYYQKGECN